MIPVLFKADAVEFDTYGIGVLADCISCEVTEERNGAFELVLKYPTTGRNYAEIKSERLIKAKPNDTAKDQMFRIYRITTPLDGVVTVYAQHLSYDLSGVAALLWSLEDAHSSPSSAATRFSPMISRMPAGTPAATPTQLTEPFWIPCVPAPFVTYRQRHSR